MDANRTAIGHEACGAARKENRSWLHQLPDESVSETPKKLTLEESIDLLDSWLAEEPTEEDERLWQDMIHDLDSYRPERPLFERYYR